MSKCKAVRGLRGSLMVGAALLLGACGGGSREPADSLAPLPDPARAPALKEVFARDFLVGAAISPDATTGAHADLLIRHVSSVTAENAMKPYALQPSSADSPDRPAPLNFAPADVIVAFAVAHDMRVRGNALLWYLYVPEWFFAGCDADPAGCLPQVRLRLHDYIWNVVRHFGGHIQAWDVAIEVVNPDPHSPTPWRTNSPWYQAYARAAAAGAKVQPWDYVADAFRFAAEARKSLGLTGNDMKLMLSEYDTELPGKRANLVRVIQELRRQGAPLDGVGHQFHLRIDADVGEVTQALIAVENLGGLVNHVTELDVNVYANPVSCDRSAAGCAADYRDSPPPSVLYAEARLYRALYAAFRRPSVQSVTTWGLDDGHTWYNAIPGSRTNYPLLFDAAGKPKWAFWAVVDPTLAIP